MTHEMRRATWSGLEGRAVVRQDRRRSQAEEPASPRLDLVSEPVEEGPPLQPTLRLLVAD